MIAMVSTMYSSGAGRLARELFMSRGVATVGYDGDVYDFVVIVGRSSEIARILRSDSRAFIIATPGQFTKIRSEFPSEGFFYSDFGGIREVVAAISAFMLASDSVTRQTALGYLVGKYFSGGEENEYSADQKQSIDSEGVS